MVGRGCPTLLFKHRGHPELGLTLPLPSAPLPFLLSHNTIKNNTIFSANLCECSRPNDVSTAHFSNMSGGKCLFYAHNCLEFLVIFPAYDPVVKVVGWRYMDEGREFASLVLGNGDRQLTLIFV